MYMWNMAAERTVFRIRKAFFRSLLRQNIGWIEMNNISALNTRLTGDVNHIQSGIGDRMANSIYYLSSSIALIIYSFIEGWELTLVILSVSPFIGVCSSMLLKAHALMSSKEQAAYARAGSIAEEVLGSIKAVVSYGGQQKEIDRYKIYVNEAKKRGILKSFVVGFSMGVNNFCVYCLYAISIWYGGKKVRDDDYDLGKVLLVMVSVLLGSMHLGKALDNIQHVASARGAAAKVYEVIDRVSEIDSSSPTGEKPATLAGRIRFKNVHFSYPARPDVTVLDGLTIEAKPGQTVALIGSSGCGKSTCVQLLLRFYDPLRGQVFLDDHDLKDLNVNWLRRHIGIVSQEPVLFDKSIGENIRYGMENATMEDVIRASKEANAFSFINALPQKFDTMVGERGAQLSGGQKQRIAIARALVSNPKILLLDEATSALDLESESIVQEALDKARKGRTTLVIAHRLSTVRTADVIIGLNKGKSVEMGTHEELMEKQGIYYDLVTSQTDLPDENEQSLDDLKKKENKVKQKADSSAVAKDSTKETDEYEDDEDLPDAPFTRLFKMNINELHYIIIGCLSSGIIGGIQPAFGLIFAEMVEAFSKPDDEMRDDLRDVSLLFVGLGVLYLVFSSLMGFMFGLSGEALTFRIRTATFRAMLRQEMGWYDRPENNTGCLTTRLANDASLVHGATGTQIAFIIQLLCNIGIGLVISFIVGWQLTLVALGVIPFVTASFYIQIKVAAGDATGRTKALEAAGAIAVECMENIRTVSCLCREEMFLNAYSDALVDMVNRRHKSALKSGFAYGMANGGVFFTLGVLFIYGGYLIEVKEMDFKDVVIVLVCILYGSAYLGEGSSLFPSVGAAKIAARRIFKLTDAVPTIDAFSTEGAQPKEFGSNIEFKGVHFSYPTRPSVPILQGLNLTVDPGQTVALVGASGCGKSTTISLLERFYDPKEGRLILGGHDSKALNIQWLRNQIGIVFQEPTLFDRSIAENIAYGDNTRKVGMEEIIQAAKNANVHSFIEALPLGYETNVGGRGTQLSGGQKQRVAIARALVRNPKILLLDEATSALDTESEKIVQEALDKARQGRTCVTIAHRLSTIQNADKIIVFEQGVVAEAGTHAQLMANKAQYYTLQSMNAV
ncbi:ATP-dependent translocase ABCB1 [Aplysia californica]|uniref:ATP-dependent translocase ABCB1 n=1 Tax=Aplysia californica TaxID=6500 RepID=A0ABM0JJZ9_APLCA|nr:ATP-dependent translocase ABCB1 [Aplysia californica]